MHSTKMESLQSVSPCRPEAFILTQWWWWGGDVPQEPGKQLRATFAAFLVFHHREAPGGHGGQ